MKEFTYERARNPAEAARSVARQQGAKFIAGGTNLLDLMKLEIETPTHLVDVQEIGLDRIEPTEEGGLRIGTLVTNTRLAADPRVRRRRGRSGDLAGESERRRRARPDRCRAGRGQCGLQRDRRARAAVSDHAGKIPRPPADHDMRSPRDDGLRAVVANRGKPE